MGRRPEGGSGALGTQNMHLSGRGLLSFNLCYHSGILANANSYLDFVVSRKTGALYFNVKISCFFLS